MLHEKEERFTLLSIGYIALLKVICVTIALMGKYELATAMFVIGALIGLALIVPATYYRIKLMPYLSMPQRALRTVTLQR